MGYWKRFAQRAASEARKDAKLDSVVSAVIALIAQGFIAFGIYVALGEFTNATAATRILTAATPFLTFPVAFLIRAAILPKTLDNELRAEIALLKNPPRPDGYDDGIFQHGRLVGVVSGVSFGSGILTFTSIENSDGLNLSEVFFYQETLLFARSVGEYRGARNVTVVDSSGSKSFEQKAVRTNVSCAVIGSASTVARA